VTGDRAQASHNFRWAGSSQAGQIASQFLGTLILSRLLTPSSFGLIAMATVVTTFANLLRDLGTTSAIIQRDELDNDLLNSVFWLNVGFGLCLAIIILAIAPIAAYFFREPAIKTVLASLAGVFPLVCSGAVHQALLERGHRFRTLTRNELASAFLGFATAVTAAFLGAGVYSLVLQTVVTTISSTLLLWISSDWRPYFSWRAAELRSIWKYSGNLTGFNLINYLARNADNMMVGRFLGSVELGWYSMAYRLMLFPLTSLSSVVSRALFPVFSRHQGNTEQMGKQFLTMVSLIALVTFPLMAGLWALRDLFIEVVLGTNWMPVAGVLRWLAPVGAIQSIMSPVGLIYTATGRTSLMFRWGLIATAIMVLGMSAGLRWGIEGVAAGYALAFAILFYPGMRIPLSLVNQNFSNIWVSVRKQLFCSMTMVGVLLLMMSFLNSESQPAFLRLFELTLAGVSIYASLTWVFMRDEAEFRFLRNL
jgi:O-antigen/teichoic acid export membrane protein